MKKFLVLIAFTFAGLTQAYAEATLYTHVVCADTLGGKSTLGIMTDVSSGHTNATFYYKWNDNLVRMATLPVIHISTVGTGVVYGGKDFSLTVEGLTGIGLLKIMSDLGRKAGFGAASGQKILEISYYCQFQH